MPANRVRSLVRSALAPLALPPDDRPDGELLACFLASRDEAAFAALVRRHGPMVLAVCRAILCDPADAEDAFQATFLVLVRRAAVIRDRAAVGGWLYSVAGRAARRLRATARRLPPLPEDILDPNADTLGVTSDIRAILDEEVARLPEVYRLAVQACYVAGRTTAEAAALLGWAKGTVLTRLAWARRRLRSRLAARGVGLAVGAFGTVLSRPAAFAVGRALLVNTIRAAVAAAAGESVSGVVSERTVTLSQGVIRAMVQYKLKWAAGAVLVAVLAGAGIGRWAAAGEPGSDPPRVARAVPPAPTPQAPVVSPAEPPRPTAPPVADEPPHRQQVPDRPEARHPVLDRPAARHPVPGSENAPTALTPPRPVASGPDGAVRQFVVSRPVGTWSREVVTPNGNGEEAMRVSVHFEEDRLTIRLVALVDRQPAETVLEADYSITRDSVVFGVITGLDTHVPAGVRVPAGAAGEEEQFIDQPFTFRFRVDGGTLTVKDLRMPGVNKQGDAGLGLVLTGRYMSGEHPPGMQREIPAKGRASYVLPRRVSPSHMTTPGPVADQPLYPTGSPEVAPGGPPAFPAPGQPGSVPAGAPVPLPN